MLPESFVSHLGIFSVCFTEPTFRRFVTLLTGWILCVSKHTVTGVIRAAGVVGKRHHSGYHRFFSQAKWTTDQVGFTLFRLLLSVVPRGQLVILSVDDTLARHTGKHISSAAMHRDPLLSTARKPFFHFGHNWVVVAVVFVFPRWGKVFSLPVLVRLYRTEKLNKKMGLAHRKKTELANELIQLAAGAFPDRHFLIVGDNAYTNRAVIRPLPKTFHFLGRARMDAAVYAPRAEAGPGSKDGGWQVHSDEPRRVGGKNCKLRSTEKTPRSRFRSSMPFGISGPTSDYYVSF